MLTYGEVMTTDLGLLTAAAAKWDAMAGELQKVETRYGETIQKITLGNDWSGVSAGVARTKFTATRYEYSAAQNQAKAIASLLRGAHEQLTDLRRKLESARDDAVAAGMTVSAEGRVAFDFARLTPAERSAYQHDPDGQATVRTAVEKWQKHLDDRVKAVSDADTHVKDALESAVVDRNRDALGQGSGADESLTGFNSYAEGDLAKAEKYVPPVLRDREDPVTVTGPDAGFTVSGIKYGKEGSVKLYADLFHATAKGEGELAGLKLSAVEDVYGGIRGTANFGASEKGVSGKAEASAGLRMLEEVRVERGSHAAYGRVEGFAGGEVSGTAKLNREEVTIGAKSFAGVKGTVAGGVESGGLGVGVVAEPWAGAGWEGSFGWRKDEKTGAWKVGGKAGAAELFGGAVGLEITVDPGKLKKTAGDVAHEIGSWFD